MQPICGPWHLRRAHLRHAHVEAARAHLHVRRVQLRLVDARRVHARHLRRTARRYHFFFGGGPCCSSTSAPSGSAAARSAASSPVIVLTSRRRSCPRPIQICLGGWTCICEVTDAPARDLLRRAVEAELQLAVRVLAVERDQHRRVGLVGHGDVVGRLAAALAALRAQRRGRLDVGLDVQRQRRRRRRRCGWPWSPRRPAAPTPAPRPRGARRVQVDLDLLLVGPAGAERHEVDRAGEDRPPVLRHALDAQVVVVDDPALVAHQRQHALALPGLDGVVQRLALGRIAVRQRAGRSSPARSAAAPCDGRRHGAAHERLRDRRLRPAAPAAARAGSPAASSPSAAPAGRGDGGRRRWWPLPPAGGAAAGRRRGACGGRPAGGRRAPASGGGGGAACAAASAAISGVIACTKPVGSQRRYSPQLQKSRSSGFSLPQLWHVLMTRPSSLLPSRAAGTCCAPACTARCSGRSPPAPFPRRACRSRRRNSRTASPPGPGCPCQITPPLSSTRIGTSREVQLQRQLHAPSRCRAGGRARPRAGPSRAGGEMSWVSSRSTPSHAASRFRMSGGAKFGSKW